MSRTKYWVFTANEASTIFRHLSASEHSVREMFEEWRDEHGLTFCVYQLERGENGNIHYQGYIEFAERKRFPTVRDLLDGAHVEKRRGNQQQAIAYCTKEETRLTELDLRPDDENSQSDDESILMENDTWYLPGLRWGEPTPVKQGRRSDLIELYEFIARDDPPELLDVIEFNPGAFFKYGRNIQTVVTMNQRERDWRTKCFIFHGNSGTGKSFTAKLLAKHMGYESKDIYYQDRTKWWHNYTGQPFIIVEEFTGQWNFEFWKCVCDYSPLQVQPKGGYTNFLGRVVVFTSNKYPYSWWQLEGDDRTQFERRVDAIIRFQSLDQMADGWVQERYSEHGESLIFPKAGRGYYWEQ